MCNINDFQLFRRHKNLEHVQHDQRVGRVSQTAKIERPRDPSIESSSSVGTRGTCSSATLTCNGTVWTLNHVLILAEFLTTSSLDLQREKELREEPTFIIFQNLSGKISDVNGKKCWLFPRIFSCFKSSELDGSDLSFVN